MILLKLQLIVFFKKCQNKLVVNYGLFRGIEIFILADLIHVLRCHRRVGCWFVTENLNNLKNSKNV